MVSRFKLFQDTLILLFTIYYFLFWHAENYIFTASTQIAENENEERRRENNFQGQEYLKEK